ncbi:hypothetical protein [Fastidiosibacter lacustris]|nr:hypothetical protein [Fastidiosibacter lacustris]
MINFSDADLQDTMLDSTIVIAHALVQQVMKSMAAMLKRLVEAKEFH